LMTGLEWESQQFCELLHRPVQTLVDPLIFSDGKNAAESGQRHHVRRTQFRSVSAVTVSAAKTAHPLRPSSFPNRTRFAGLRFGIRVDWHEFGAKNGIARSGGPVFCVESSSNKPISKYPCKRRSIPYIPYPGKGLYSS